MDDWKVVQWGKEMLSKEHDKPFFLACGLYRPHLPWYVPRKYFDMYPPDEITLPNIDENDLDDVPPIGRSFVVRRDDHKNVTETDNWRRAVAGYLACIRFVDDMIGELLDALDNSSYADNTMIVLWGDHGWHLGEKTPLAQICTLGRGHTRTAHDFSAGHGAWTVRPHGESGRSVSHIY